MEGGGSCICLSPDRTKGPLYDTMWHSLPESSAGFPGTDLVPRTQPPTSPGGSWTVFVSRRARSGLPCNEFSVRAPVPQSCSQEGPPALAGSVFHEADVQKA